MNQEFSSHKTTDKLRDFWYILGGLALSRIALTILGVLIRTKQFAFTFDWNMPGPLSSHAWLNVWGLWDSGWYYRIATEWYHAGQPLGFAFFPLYPGIVHSLGFVFGHQFPLGVAVANISLVISCWLLFKLAGNRFQGWWAVASLVAFPSAFVLSGMFTESLYLAIALGAFVAARRQRWWLVGLLGFALSLSRPVGFLIALPMALEYMRQRNWSWRKIDAQAAWLCIIPLGLPLWAWYNHALTGDWLNFVHVQAAWRRNATNPISALWTALRADNFYDQALALFALSAAAMLVLWRRTLSVSEQAWAWLSLTIPLFTGIYSIPRFVLVIFPLYLGFARTSMRPVWRYAILAVLVAIQVALFVYWPKQNSWVV